MIFRKDKTMRNKRNKKKVKDLKKDILKNTLRVVLATLIAETNTAIDFNKLLKRILIEILFELLLYINSKREDIFLKKIYSICLLQNMKRKVEAGRFTQNLWNVSYNF